MDGVERHSVQATINRNNQGCPNRSSGREPCSLPMRRFPPPWKIEPLDGGGFKIVDLHGRRLR